MVKKGDVIIIIAVALLAFLPLTMLINSKTAVYAQVYSDGTLLYTLPLNTDAQIEVTSQYGSNTVTVQNGTISVTKADCNGDCIACGRQSRAGATIVCLPNRLVIRLCGRSETDAVTY